MFCQDEEEEEEKIGKKKKKKKKKQKDKIEEADIEEAHEREVKDVVEESPVSDMEVLTSWSMTHQFHLQNKLILAIFAIYSILKG